MKKLFLSLMLAGFCSEIMSGELNTGTHSADCIIDYSEDQCQHSGNSTYKNQDGAKITISPAESYFSKKFHFLEITLKQNPNSTNHPNTIKINIPDLLKFFKEYPIYEENAVKRREIEDSYNIDKNQLEIKKTVLKETLKSTALFSGATLFASLFFNAQNKIRYGLFAGSLGLGLCSYLFTHNKRETILFNQKEREYNKTINPV